jgi:uridine kinase
VIDSLARCRALLGTGRRFVIGVAGGSGSGKTTLAHTIAKHLGMDLCGVLAQDSYYIDQSARFDGDGGSVNFDHPSSLDFPLLNAQLERLLEGQPIDVPIYDFATHSRRKAVEHFAPRPLVIVDGTLILDAVHVRSRFCLSVFVETREEHRFARRLERDTHERGRTPAGVYLQFTRQVKPMHDQFVEPSKAHASLRVSGEGALDDELKRVMDTFLSLPA